MRHQVKVLQMASIVFFSFLLATGCGRLSETTSKPPTDFTGPIPAPAHFVSTNTGNSLRFSWDPVPGYEVTGYTLYFGVSLNNSSSVTFNMTPITVTGTSIELDSAMLTNNKTYAFFVRAVNTQKTPADFSKTLRTTFIDSVAPGMVEGVRLTEHTASPSVTLTWSNPKDPDLSSIKVVRKVDAIPSGIQDGVVVYSGLAESLEDSTISFGKQYYYRVFAVDRVGNVSDPSQSMPAFILQAVSIQ